MDFFDISLIFAILNGKVFTAFNRKLLHDFTAAGLHLSPEQWTVLFYLSQQDMLTQRQLCDKVYKDKPSMTRIINTMEREGLVKRMENQADFRTNLVHLTARGREMKERAQKVAVVTLREACRGLGLSDIGITQEVLRRVFENTKVGKR